jgi:hypothetical protein
MSGAFSIKLGQVIMSHVALFQFLRILERELAVTEKIKEYFFADFTQVTDFLNPISLVPFLFHHLWLPIFFCQIWFSNSCFLCVITCRNWY